MAYIKGSVAYLTGVIDAMHVIQRILKQYPDCNELYEALLEIDKAADERMTRVKNGEGDFL